MAFNAIAYLVETLRKKLPPTLKPGDRNWYAALLRRALSARGFADPAWKDPAVQVSRDYDQALAENVVVFQTTRELEVDGFCGPETWAALCVEDWDDAGELTLFYARRDAYAGAKEEGGNNAGPWVDGYLEGTGATVVPWCVASSTTWYRRALARLGLPVVIEQRLSTSYLVLEAHRLGRLVASTARQLLIRNKIVLVP
ncbi:MAG: peptidoglycan-binding domain-containing protein, partial [Phycisphaerae bacterium]